MTTFKSRLTSHYVFGLFKQSHTSFYQHRQCWRATVHNSDTFPNESESERKDEATWYGSMVSCSLTLHPLKGYLLSNGISWQVKGTKAKWHWHRRNEETHTKKITTMKHTHTHTHTHTHSDHTGIQTTSLINTKKDNWRGNAFNKEELRKIAKGATVIQSRIKLGTSLSGGDSSWDGWSRYSNPGEDKIWSLLPAVQTGPEAYHLHTGYRSSLPG